MQIMDKNKYGRCLLLPDILILVWIFRVSYYMILKVVTCMCKKHALLEEIMKHNGIAFKNGLKDGIPIGLGYLAVSFTFGIMAAGAGLSPWQSVLMSFTNLTSAGQFAALGIIQAGSSYMEMAVTQFIINLRYCLMSCSLSQKLEEQTPFHHRLFKIGRAHV